jgi:hypothetical protein
MSKKRKKAKTAKPKKHKYIRVDDFFIGSKKTTIAEDVRKQVTEENARDIIDRSALRRGEDWSYLGHRVVGAEGEE